MAVNSFTTAREPGIYKESYLKDIYKRYGGDEDDAPPPPELPDWCEEEEESKVDEDGEPVIEGKKPKRGGKFMEGVPGVKLWTMQPTLWAVQKKVTNTPSIFKCVTVLFTSQVQNACDWKKSGFPGCQPVSMDRQNLSFLQEKPYKVTNFAMNFDQVDVMVVRL